MFYTTITVTLKNGQILEVGFNTDSSNVYHILKGDKLSVNFAKNSGILFYMKKGKLYASLRKSGSISTLSEVEGLEIYDGDKTCMSAVCSERTVSVHGCKTSENKKDDDKQCDGAAFRVGLIIGEYLESLYSEDKK